MVGMIGNCPLARIEGPVMDVQIASSMEDETAVAYRPVSPLLCDNYTTQNVTSNTPAQMAAIGRDEHLAKVEIAVQAVIFALAVLGNGFVVVTLACRKKKLGRMNLMIIHLSLADLFVAFLHVLPQLLWDVTGTFYGGNFLCKFVTYFQVAGMFASSYVLVTTALDRFLVICHPLASHVWTTARIHAMVACAWILSLIFSLPQLVIFSYREIPRAGGSFTCMANFEPAWTLQLYVTWITLAIFVIPSGILCFVYGRICYTVWRSTLTKEPSLRRKSLKQSPAQLTLSADNNNRKCYHTITRPSSNAPETRRISTDSRLGLQSCCQVRNSGCRSPSMARLTKSQSVRSPASLGPRAHVRTMAKSKVKTIKLTLTVILCYILCWAPFFISQMWAAWDADAPFEGQAMVIILLLASLNSCSNPWIYMAFSDVICHKLSTKCRRHSRDRPRPDSTGNSSGTKQNNKGYQNKSLVMDDSSGGGSGAPNIASNIAMRNLYVASKTKTRASGTSSEWV